MLRRGKLLVWVGSSVCSVVKYWLYNTNTNQHEKEGWIFRELLPRYEQYDTYMTVFPLVAHNTTYNYFERHRLSSNHDNLENLLGKRVRVAVRIVNAIWVALRKGFNKPRMPLHWSQIRDTCVSIIMSVFGWSALIQNIPRVSGCVYVEDNKDHAWRNRWESYLGPLWLLGRSICS